MEKFNLERAKGGFPVCTRDGRNVRIVDFELKSKRPILAVVEQKDGMEFPVQYYADGTICKRQDLRVRNHEHEIITEVRAEDLMMS